VTGIAVIGRGAIGGPIIDALRSGALPGIGLAGVLVRSVRTSHETDSLEALLARRPRLVIEAAGQEAAKVLALPVLRSGSDLLLFSTGALADDSFETACHAALTAPSHGRLLLSTGAVGGLDMLKALRASGTLRSVRLRSTTLPGPLLQPWMTSDQTERIRSATAPITVFAGTAREASRRFPSVANVAATIGFSSLGLDRVEVELVADPAATAKRHEIEAVADESRCRVVVENAFSSTNPRTSAVTPYAALRLVRDWIEPIVAGA
jgi:aspartate dehydrogenase